MSDFVVDRPGAVGAHRSGARVRRRWVVGAVLVAALVAVGGYLGAGAYAYLQLSSVHPACGTRPFAAQTPADFEAYDGDGSLVVDTTPYRFSDYTTVALPSRDSSLTIRGWYAPPASDPAGPVVIAVHGRDSCRRDPVVMLPAAMLHRAGFGVLIIDLRNHGDSDADNGRWAGGAKEFRDVLGAWDWLIGQGVDPARIGLFGASLGAGTVTIAMGEEPRVVATWADSSYADEAIAAGEYAQHKGYPSWVSTSALPIGRLLSDPELGTRSPIEAVSRLAGRPFAIVHGLADATIRPHHAVDLAAAAYAGGTPVSPWLIPGAEHTEGMLLVPDAYEARLIAFFTSALGAP